MSDSGRGTPYKFPSTAKHAGNSHKGFDFREISTQSSDDKEDYNTSHMNSHMNSNMNSHMSLRDDKLCDEGKEEDGNCDDELDRVARRSATVLRRSRMSG